MVGGHGSGERHHYVSSGLGKANFATFKIRVYFIDPSNNVTEVSVNSSSLPGVGVNHIGWTVPAGSGFLYAINNGTDIRVGFQYSIGPADIWEAELTSSGWQLGRVSLVFIHT